MSLEADKPVPEYRILVIEDDDRDWQLIERALSKSTTITVVPTRVTHLNNGITALRHRSYDAVLLDLILQYDGPTNGLDTVVAVVKEAPSVPIIVLSNMADIETAVRSISYGAMSYLEKPPNPHRLESTLRQVIERHYRDDITRRLTWKSLSQYANNEDISSLAMTIGGHIDSIEQTLHHVRSFLAAANPKAAAEVDKLMVWGNTTASFQEIRRLLQLENPDDRDTQPGIKTLAEDGQEGSPKHRAISDRALRRVFEESDGHTLKTPDEASAYLLHLQESSL